MQDVELAYELPDAYFHIQTCDDGFDYTLYNKDFTERDGGILETDGDGFHCLLERLRGQLPGLDVKGYGLFVCCGFWLCSPALDYPMLDFPM